MTVAAGGSDGNAAGGLKKRGGAGGVGTDGEREWDLARCELRDSSIFCFASSPLSGIGVGVSIFRVLNPVPLARAGRTPYQVDMQEERIVRRWRLKPRGGDTRRMSTMRRAYRQLSRRFEDSLAGFLGKVQW